MTVQVARALGATEIVVSDVAPARLAAARSSAPPARWTRAPRTPRDAGIEVDAYIDCSGAPPAIAQAIRAVRPAGRVVLVGMGADEITLPVGLIQGRELTITGTFRYANTYPTAIALAASGRVDLDGMVTARYALDEAETRPAPGPRPHRHESHRPTRRDRQRISAPTARHGRRTSPAVTDRARGPVARRTTHNGRHRSRRFGHPDARMAPLRPPHEREPGAAAKRARTGRYRKWQQTLDPGTVDEAIR